ncbi:MAG: nucleotide exchange factor GrpE [Cyclobacteriaceae bacterium]
MEDKNNHTEEDIKTENMNQEQVENQETEDNNAELEEELEQELNHEGDINLENTAVKQLEEQLSESKDKYLRLYSEYENFRRRTSKERLELIKTANEDLMSALLPVVDDFERALKLLPAEGETTQVKEGFQLIQNKLMKTLENKGLSLMDVEQGSDFNPEYHEAISQIPAPEDKLKGKVVDVVEKGYYLGEKVIRFAKVVIGA